MKIPQQLIQTEDFGAKSYSTRNSPNVSFLKDVVVGGACMSIYSIPDRPLSSRSTDTPFFGRDMVHVSSIA